MIRTLARLLLIIFGCIGGILVFCGLSGQAEPAAEAVLFGVSVLTCTAFGLAILEGQDRQERILNEVLRELQGQDCQPDEATDRAAPAPDRQNR